LHITFAFYQLWLVGFPLPRLGSHRFVVYWSCNKCIFRRYWSGKDTTKFKANTLNHYGEYARQYLVRHGATTILVNTVSSLSSSELSPVDSFFVHNLHVLLNIISATVVHFAY